MELEDISWPGELEEEEEAAENLDEYDVVMVEEMEEEEGREPDADFNYESQRRESTDDEEDEEAKAWLQAHPGRTLPQPSLPRHSCSEGELTSPGKVSRVGEGYGRPSGRVVPERFACSPLRASSSCSLPVMVPDK